MSRAINRPVAPEQDRAQLWALFALIVYTPLPLASNRPWALALLGLLVGGLLLWVVWSSNERKLFFAWRHTKFPLLLLCGWLALLLIQLVPLPSSLLQELGQRLFYDPDVQHNAGDTISIDIYSTKLYLAKACILLAVFWLILTLVNSRRRIELLAKVVVCSGLLQALVGVVIMATGTTYQLFFVSMHEVRAHGTFASPNHFAGYLEMTLAMGIGLMIAKLDGSSVANWRQRIHGWLAVLLSSKAMLRLALIIMVVGLVASRSRMGNSAFFSSLLITGVLAVIFMQRKSNTTQQHANLLRSTIVFITSLIVLDVIIIGGVVGVEKVVQRIESTNIEMQAKPSPPMATGNAVQYVEPVPSSEESLELRSKAGIASVQIVRDYPWLGTGGGAFHLAFQHYRPIENYGYYDHAHNDFVEFASESGLVGLMLLATMVLHSLWLSIKSMANGVGQLNRGMAFASVMGITSLLIHGAVDFNLQIPADAMLFMILLSLPYLMNALPKR